jgi:glycerophosphoryl diester phosphodiesterase
LVGLFNWMAEALLTWAGPRPAILLLLVSALLTILLTVTLSLSFLTKGVNAVLINRLYSDYSGGSTVRPPDLSPRDGAGKDLDPIRVFWLAIIAVFLILSGAGIVWIQHLDLREDVAITAHRGSSRAAPENTLSALRQAVADGADYAEIDVQTTRDGQVVLLHDRDFMRLAGDPRRVEDLTLAETGEIDVGGWFDPAFSGERIPTLAEAIDLVRGQLRLNIELKFNRPDPNLAAAVVEVVRQKGFERECVFTSLDLASLQEVERIDSGLTTGLVLTRAVGNPARLPVDFLSLNTSAAVPRLISYAHRNGKAVHVWTVNDPETMTRMVEAGVDNVITDEPRNMRQVLDERSRLTPAEKLALLLRRRIIG